MDSESHILRPSAFLYETPYFQLMLLKLLTLPDLVIHKTKNHCNFFFFFLRKHFFFFFLNYLITKLQIITLLLCQKVIRKTECILHKKLKAHKPILRPVCIIKLYNTFTFSLVLKNSMHTWLYVENHRKYKHKHFCIW